MRREKQPVILVVDDDPTILKLVAKHLHHHGYDVVTVQKGADVLERAKTISPDLVLLDVMMPDIDGFDVCHRLKAEAETHQIPVIFLTALIDIPNKLRGFEAGGVDYITKPVRLAELSARVDTHLTLRRLQTQLNAQNEQLLQEIGRREAAESALKLANEQLADKVKTRTAELEAVNADLTQKNIEREQAEIALRKSYTRYHNLAANIPGMIFQFLLHTDGSFTFPYVSPGSWAIYGLTPEEIYQHPNQIFEVVHSGDISLLHETIRYSAETLSPWHWVGRIIIEDRTKWIRGVSRPEKQSDGSILWDGLLIDITDRKEMEEQLYQAQRLKAVGQLAGGVAHNFNNLLTAIMGYADLALEAIPAESSTAEDLQGIQKMARRGADLTRQLLTFTRNQPTEPKVIDLNELIRQLEKMLRQLLNEAIDLQTCLAPNLGFVKVDANQFEQILVNLALNARDAMPEGGKLTIETAAVYLNETQATIYNIRPGDYLLLQVSDTGIGMSDAVKGHIFEPFFSTKDVNQGTGLGLSICFGMVKQHRGHIVVESEPGQGATFKIFIPRITDKLPVPGPNAQPSGLPVGTETILLVEDEAAIRAVAARALRRQGYTILEAENGEEALRLIETAPVKQASPTFDLLVTDVVMPRIGGFHLAEQLKARYPELKILFMSGYAHRQLQQQTNEPFLAKPYSSASLIRKVRAVLDGA